MAVSEEVPVPEAEELSDPIDRSSYSWYNDSDKQKRKLEKASFFVAIATFL